MAEVRQMTLHDVAIMHAYWKRNPPLRILVTTVAKALGVEFPDLEEKPKYMTAEEFQRMVQATGGKIPGLGSI